MRQSLSVICMAMALALALSGCGGSPDKDKVLPVHCLDKPDRGPCKARIPSYYYDYPSNTCRRFQYGGCRGHVPFETRSACEQACVGSRG